MTSSDRSGVLPLDISEPVRPGTSPEPPSSTPAVRLAASDGEPAPAACADPDRLHSRCGPQFDPSVPAPARVYGYWLGGKDHYEADRQAAEAVIRLRPEVVTSARANRAFLARVV